MSLADQPQPDKHESLSDILKRLCATDDTAVFTLGEVIHHVGPRSFGALLFIFAVPNLLPWPPGATTITGLPLVLLAPQMALGRRVPWLPARVMNRTIRGADIDKMFGKIIPKLEVVEKLSSPRLTHVFGPVGDRVIGVIASVLAVVIFLPIPLGNLVPAVSVSFLALGLFNRDGVLAILGYLVAVISVGLLIFGLIAAYHVTHSLIGVFRP